MTFMKGIDVSHWQGAIDWKSVKASGVTFAILKAGGSDAGFYKDPRFERNYAGCITSGMRAGAYYFVGKNCISYNDGKADAQRFLVQLKGKHFDMPVYIDLEAPGVSTKAGNTQAAIGFCETMENAGYFTGIYASDISGFRDRLNMSALTAYTWWVARYGSKPAYARNPNNLGIWQYSSSGRVPGISGNVDLDYCYFDFPSIIKNKGMNGYSKTAPAKTVKPVQTRPAAPSSGFHVGDWVKVKNAITYDGLHFKTWYSKYKIMEVKGDRVVIGVNGVVTCAIKDSNIIKA